MIFQTLISLLLASSATLSHLPNRRAKRDFVFDLRIFGNSGQQSLSQQPKHQPGPIPISYIPPIPSHETSKPFHQAQVSSLIQPIKRFNVPNSLEMSPEGLQGQTIRPVHKSTPISNETRLLIQSKYAYGCFTLSLFLRSIIEKKIPLNHSVNQSKILEEAILYYQLLQDLCKVSHHQLSHDHTGSITITGRSSKEGTKYLALEQFQQAPACSKLLEFLKLIIESKLISNDILAKILYTIVQDMCGPIDVNSLNTPTYSVANFSRCLAFPMAIKLRYKNDVIIMTDLSESEKSWDDLIDKTFETECMMSYSLAYDNLCQMKFFQ